MKDFSKTKRITSVRDIPLEQEKDEFQIQRYIEDWLSLSAILFLRLLLPCRESGEVAKHH